MGVRKILEHSSCNPTGSCDNFGDIRGCLVACDIALIQENELTQELYIRLHLPREKVLRLNIEMGSLRAYIIAMYKDFYDYT